jgi:hypothetical protein
MIYVIDLAGLDQRRDDCPMFGPPSEPANKTFFRISAIGRMDLSTMLLSSSMPRSSMKSVRPRQGIADRHGQFALQADQRELCPKPRLERVDQRSAFLLADEAPFIGASASDPFLNGTQLSNQPKRSLAVGDGPGVARS